MENIAGLKGTVKPKITSLGELPKRARWDHPWAARAKTAEFNATFFGTSRNLECCQVDWH